MPAIQIDGISKSYTIFHARNRPDTFRDQIVEATKRLRQRLLLGQPVSVTQRSRETFWALENISLRIEHGDRIGVIGRNGAGKSTLLKILSRITPPTRGRFTMQGRVASLLEVGTGFHPELSGRENIFLNGAILGMSRREITSRFDEIVAFSEIEKFLDTPVKRYSSGMYVRLAFAVAAHLSPEILLIDEVLAVGDARFQKRCLGKMESLAGEGRTVLFVSHNMAAVKALCNKGVVLHEGRLTASGEIEGVIQAYESAGSIAAAEVDLRDWSQRGGDGEMRFSAARITDRLGAVCQEFSLGSDITIEFTVRSPEKLHSAKLAVQIATSEGLRLCNMVDTDSGFRFDHPRAEERLSVAMDDVRLYPGVYYLSLWAGSVDSMDTYDFVENCLMFTIKDGGDLTMRPLPKDAGLLFWTPTWSRAS